MTTINDNAKVDISALITEGAGRDKIEGYLLFNGVAKPAALAYLKELGLIGRVTFRSWLRAELAIGYISPDVFASAIAKASDNVRKHIGAYESERVLGNSIHALYSADIKALVESEALVKGEVKEEKASWKAPRTPKDNAKSYHTAINKLVEEYDLEDKKEAVELAKDDKVKLAVLWDDIITSLRY